jgi:hypothetical protein
VWLALTPFAAFAAAFLFGAVALWFLGKGTKILQTETKSGKTVHVESHLGTLDVCPETELDSRLASIPLYPGAMLENALAAESACVLRVGWKTAQDISATYWTPVSEEQVWNFYQQQLPDWPRNWFRLRARNLSITSRGGFC